MSKACKKCGLELTDKEIGEQGAYCDKCEHKEVQIVEVKAVTSNPVETAMKVLQGGATPEQLDKILDLQLKWEANEARKAFNASMVEVHRNMPKVPKNLNNAHTKSKYAALDDIISKTKGIYTEYGFSIMFYEGKSDFEGHIRVCADVIHSVGHKEQYHYDVPLDGVGIAGKANMTKIHGKASSVSYGRRYLMCMIWNIPTGDDDDGNKAGQGSVETIDDKQIIRIREFLDNGVNEKGFLAHMKVDSVENIPKDKFQDAIVALEYNIKKNDVVVDVEEEGK